MEGQIAPMAYLIGTDEAGYGPNFGPLVISASVWQTPGDNEQDLYTLLTEVVKKNLAPGDGKIPIADSKVLYKSGGRLRGLESGLLPVLDTIGAAPRSWQELWSVLAPDSQKFRDQLGWYHGYDCPLPIDLDADSLATATERLGQTFSTVGVRCCNVVSRAVFPGEFNDLCKKLGNKATVLSQLTLELVRQQLSLLDDEPVFICCDKHGGRSKYGPFLQQTFPDYIVEIFHESRQQSLYRWGPTDRRVEIRFQAGGEQFLPAALASMASKYLRELAMKAFNQFWCARVDDLAPTAGYPLDARRFRSEIHAAQHESHINDHEIWRNC